MNSLLIFLFKTSTVFIIFYLIYQLLLSKHTFYQLNRIILLLIIPFSLYIATTDYTIPINTKNVEIPSFVELGKEKIYSNKVSEEVIIKKEFIDYKTLLIAIYILGCIITLFSFVASLIKLYILKTKSKITKTDNYQLIYTEVTETFSCFNWIFIPKDVDYTINHLIIEHEKKHVDQKHTFDLLVTEIFISLFWFNPFVYLFRKSLKSLHEYQADSEVLKNKKTSAIQYLNLLKTEIENSMNTNIYSYFGHPIIKKRIEMITKTKSHTLLKLKYLFIIPIAFLCMVSFTKQNSIIPDTVLPKIVKDKDTKPSISPIKENTKTEITAKYGPAKHPILKSMRHHNGIDFRAANGTPIVATANGVISNASYEGKWGNLIIIQHENGYKTLYAHLSKFNCKPNQIVKKGEIIGYSGSTGMVTGPHLHYSIKHNNKYVNPIDFIN